MLDNSPITRHIISCMERDKVILDNMTHCIGNKIGGRMALYFKDLTKQLGE